MVARCVVLASLVSCASPSFDGSSRRAQQVDCASGEITELSPADGDIVVPVGASISFRVAPSASSGAVRLWIDRGASGGWQTVVPDSQGLASFSPVEPLAPLTQYTARVEACGVPMAQTSFRTLGPPVGDTIVGRTYEYDLLSSDLRWIEPKTVPPRFILEKVFDVTTLLLVQATAARDDQLDIVVALGEDDLGTTVQHTCVAPTALTVDFTYDPYFAIGPIDLVIADGDEPFVLSDVEFSGHLEPGGEAIRELYLSAVVDLRQIESSSQIDLCEAFKNAVTCTPCPDQETDTTEPQCMLVKATNPRAPWVPKLVIDPDPVRDEGC